MTLRTPSLLRLGALATAATLTLAGCAAPAASVPAAPSASTVAFSDAWVKAADDGMTAAFGDLVNDGDAEATIVSATSSATPMIELHETVQNESGQSVMREIEGGFTIPAHGTRTLSPGGDHLMFMGVTEPLRAGAEVTITLTFADDSTIDVVAPVKEFAGANETYDGGDMGDMDHGDGGQ